MIVNWLLSFARDWRVVCWHFTAKSQSRDKRTRLQTSISFIHSFVPCSKAHKQEHKGQRDRRTEVQT